MTEFLCNRCNGKIRFIQYADKIEVWDIDASSGELVDKVGDQYGSELSVSIYCPVCDKDSPENSPLNKQFECNGWGLIKIVKVS